MTSKHTIFCTTHGEFSALKPSNFVISNYKYISFLLLVSFWLCFWYNFDYSLYFFNAYHTFFFWIKMYVFVRATGEKAYLARWIFHSPSKNNIWISSQKLKKKLIGCPICMLQNIWISDLKCFWLPVSKFLKFNELGTTRSSTYFVKISLLLTFGCLCYLCGWVAAQMTYSQHPLFMM